MSNSYKISFKDLQQEGLKGIFQSLYHASQLLEIDFYLIGAIARDAWFVQKGKTAIGTRDIDFAVLVTSEPAYHDLKQFLLKEEGFTAVRRNEYTIFDKTGQQIDLLPFGAIEIEGNKFIDTAGVIHTNLSGFREVYEHASETIEFEEEFKFKVSSLSGIVLLKLIAYDDRPEHRSKDIQDIGVIINYYFDLEFDKLLDKHIDLMGTFDKWEMISARVIGREMKKMLDSNPFLKERVISILQKNISSAEESVIGKLLLPILFQGSADIEEITHLLQEIINGIEDSLSA